MFQKCVETASSPSFRRKTIELAKSSAAGDSKIYTRRDKEAENYRVSFKSRDYLQSESVSRPQRDYLLILFNQAHL